MYVLEGRVVHSYLWPISAQPAASSLATVAASSQLSLAMEMRGNVFSASVPGSARWQGPVGK